MSADWLDCQAMDGVWTALSMAPYIIIIDDLTGMNKLLENAE
jgi:hypothetical protein